jgi:hypothetical protein
LINSLLRLVLALGYKLTLKIKHRISPRITLLNILKAFPEYAPNSAGKYRQSSKLTIQTAKSIFTKVNELIVINSIDKEVIPILEFPKRLDFRKTDKIHKLQLIFNSNKSDKASKHSYQLLYAPILESIGEQGNLLEIGIGSKSSKYVSNMGKHARPGASLNAFKEFLPGWDIYGADIDSTILFSEDRIKTFFVNQLEEESLRQLILALPKRIDLIIDDGLHSPDANINVVKFAYFILKKNGWLVIEDISYSALSLWKVIARVIQEDFESYIINDDGTIVFAIRKLNDK